MGFRPGTNAALEVGALGVGETPPVAGSLYVSGNAGVGAAPILTGDDFGIEMNSASYTYIGQSNSGNFVSPCSVIEFAGSGQTVYLNSGGSATTYMETIAGPVYTPAGEFLLTVASTNFTVQFGVCSQGNQNSGVTTTPIASGSPATALALGTVWQNPNAWDVTLLVTLAITANTSLVVSLGVGPSTPPAVTSLISGTTALGLVVVPIRVPASYYALLETSGTGTIAIVGQVLENS